jgi:polyisoprenoid-binding protein YceI
MTLSAPSAPQIKTTTWQIDPAHSLVEFGVRHMMFTTVKGRFTGLSGTIIQVADDPAQSSVTAEIDATSISTGDAQRDAHLRGADFFDVEQYPTISFTSTRIEGSGESFTLIGDLTIKGVTRELSLEATYNGRGTNPFGKVVAGFSAETKINRKDFGLNWTVALETGGVLVGDSIKISIELQAVEANG